MRVRAWLIDVHGRTDWHDVEQRLDVFVAEAHAAVTDRAANRGRLVRTVKGVAISKVETERAEHAFVFALPRAIWRDDDVSVGDDLLPFGRLQRCAPTVRRTLYDIAAIDGDLAPVGEWDVLSAVQVNEAQPSLLRLLDEGPIGGHPLGIRLLRLHQ